MKNMTGTHSEAAQESGDADICTNTKQDTRKNIKEESRWNDVLVNIVFKGQMVI